MLLQFSLLVILFTSHFVKSLDNGLARTPPMGWLHWERFRCIVDCETYPNQCINDALFKRTADRMVSDGYLAAGYEYVNIDDCWPEHERNEKGEYVADRKRFPGGMKPLADYVHSKGLKLGIYTDMGTKTCAGYPASIFSMQQDTQSFADWGIDLIKVDGCNSCTKLFPEGFKALGFYMNLTGRPMLYSCEWPLYDPVKDYKDIAKTCNTWRSYVDMQDSWDGLLKIINYNGDHQDDIGPFVGPGNFNDMDMLLIGDFGLSRDQAKTQFAIWAILAAPLYMSADLDQMEDWEKEILLNKEIIAVNQDPLGIMGRRIYNQNSQQTWMRKLGSDEMAVAIMSTRTDIPVYMEFNLQQLDMKGTYKVRDLYLQKDVGNITQSYKAIVNPTGIVMFKLTPMNEDDIVF